MLDKEYYEKHKYCPTCGSNCLEVTCVGYFNKDMNKARCKCGWIGTVDDLVPVPIIVYEL